MQSYLCPVSKIKSHLHRAGYVLIKIYKIWQNGESGKRDGEWDVCQGQCAALIQGHAWLTATATPCEVHSESKAKDYL